MVTTSNRNYPIIEATEFVSTGPTKINLLAGMVDADVDALFDAMVGKAPAVHSHGIGDVTGLIAALADKMDASTAFTLDGLSNVYGADAAVSGYILVQTPTGWTAASALSVLGTHGHTIGEITGLPAALAACAPLTGATFTGSVVAKDTVGVSASPAANAHFWMYDEVGSPKAIVYWNRTTNQAVFQVWGGVNALTHDLATDALYSGVNALHHDGNAARRPQGAAGLGQWVAFAGTAGGAVTMPPGGSWAWVGWLVTVATGALGVGSHYGGVNSGGATVLGPPGASYCWQGFCWRVS